MQDKIDVKTTSTGDLEVDDSGDIKLASALETLQQDALFRLQTAHMDYEPDPYIGANLPSYKRNQNTRRTADYMKASVLESLTKDGRFSPGMVAVDVVPIAKNQVAVYVFIKDAVQGTEEDVYERYPVAMVSATVDFDTGLVTALTGGTV